MLNVDQDQLWSVRRKWGSGPGKVTSPASECSEQRSKWLVIVIQSNSLPAPGTGKCPGWCYSVHELPAPSSADVVWCLLVSVICTLCDTSGEKTLAWQKRWGYMQWCHVVMTFNRRRFDKSRRVSVENNVEEDKQGGNISVDHIICHFLLQPCHFASAQKLRASAIQFYNTGEN